MCARRKIKRTRRSRIFNWRAHVEQFNYEQSACHFSLRSTPIRAVRVENAISVLVRNFERRGDVGVEIYADTAASGFEFRYNRKPEILRDRAAGQRPPPPPGELCGPG